jgi:Zn-finger nucleic acid-binding protein
MADRQGVEIDYCPQCRGVWLDRGELDKIIDRAQAQQATPPPEYRREDYRQYDDDDDDDRNRFGRRRRGGFLGNLFDFD